MTFTFGSLFAGIGGLDLGLERAGFTCNWQVELDDYARRVLAKHWPDIRRWDDIRTFPPSVADADSRWRQNDELCPRGYESGLGCEELQNATYHDWSCDVICGGFPCQDISYAGTGAGLDGERSGLFFELIRVVRQLKPRYVLLENVAALLSRGLDRVLGTLAEVGYDAEWHCVPAAHVGAPHIRDRVFIIAERREVVCTIGQRREPRRNDNTKYDRDIALATSQHANDVSDALRIERQPGARGRGVRESDSELADAALCTRDDIADSRSRSDSKVPGQETPGPTESARGCGSDVPDTNVTGLPQRQTENASGAGENHRAQSVPGNTGATQSRIRDMVDGVSPGLDGHGGWQSEWDGVPRVVTEHVPNRVAKLRCLGNAVVPQVAEYIAMKIMDRMR